MEASLIGRNVTLERANSALPKAYRFVVGDNSEIAIHCEDCIEGPGHRRARDARPRRRCGPRGRRTTSRSRSGTTSSTSPTRAAVERALVEDDPARSSTAPPGPTWTAPRSTSSEAMAVNADRRRASWPRPRPRWRAGDLPLDRLRLRRHARRSRTSSPTSRPAVRLRPVEARRASTRRPRPTRATSSCARPGSSASPAATSSTRCSRWRDDQDEVRGGARPGRLPDLHRPSRRGARAAARRRGLRHPPHGRRRASAPGTSSRWRSSARRASTAA